VDLVRALGADHVIDYTREGFGKTCRRYDLILDTAGNRSLSLLRRALRPGGTLVIVGGETGGRWIGGADRQVRALLLSPFVRQRLRSFVMQERQDDLQFLGELLQTGAIQPALDRTYPLLDVAEAIRYLEAGHARGKVVLTA
jgi:NADPH:quinone reductase-like Zn-dependent oxidoreductase